MTQLSIRRLEPSDLDGVRAMFDRVSVETRSRRFFSPSLNGPRWELDYLGHLDGSKRVALVAEVDGQIVGIARFHGTEHRHAEVAITVEDECQHHGIGRRLMAELVRAARDAGVVALDLSLLGDNGPALRLLRNLAPGARLHLDHGVFETSVALAG